MKVQMKKTVEEEIQSKLKRLSKKNPACSILMKPIMGLSMLFFRIIHFVGSNKKRIGMLMVTLCLFTVYSSFSFPMFIANHYENSFDYDYLEQNGALSVDFANQEELNLDMVELLDDADVLLDEEQEKGFTHGLAVADKYDAEEILQYTEGQISAKDTSKDTSQDTSKDTSKVNHQGKEDPAFSKDDWRLILINKQNSVPDDYELTLGSINTLKGSMKCDERIIDDLLAMLKDASEEKVTLAICSPYRDMEYQQMLFNRKIKRYMNMGMSYMEAYQLSSQAVTVPGASEHQIGLALDIVTNNYMTLDEGFGETAAGIWLAENCHKYGFILRYPLGKEYITGIEYEPWHFRYVGEEAATIIMENGITLEEFWEDYL